MTDQGIGGSIVAECDHEPAKAENIILMIACDMLQGSAARQFFAVPDEDAPGQDTRTLLFVEENSGQDGKLDDAGGLKAVQSVESLHLSGVQILIIKTDVSGIAESRAST